MKLARRSFDSRVSQTHTECLETLLSLEVLLDGAHVLLRDSIDRVDRADTVLGRKDLWPIEIRKDGPGRLCCCRRRIPASGNIGRPVKFPLVLSGAQA